jgi:hypothetical protein
MPGYEGGGELAVAPAFPLKIPIFDGTVYCTLGQIGQLTGPGEAAFPAPAFAF